MNDLREKEHYLHAIVKEFLEIQDYTDTLEAYEEELTEKNVEPDSNQLPSPQDESCIKNKDDLTRMFQLGNSASFWKLWDQHIPKGKQEENDTQRLVFSLHLYFAVFPLLEDEGRLSPVEASMVEFKKYLESNGAALSQTTEFVAFYALPYVPNPKNHPAFKKLFEDEWNEDLKERLTLFLDDTLYSDPLPYLYKLLKGASSISNHDLEERENDKEVMKEEIKQSEDRANSYFQKFAKLQEDHTNLIGIAAELVDSLESCVRGKMVTPDYLQHICERLFAGSISKEDKLDLTVPGTASSMLRASVSMDTQQTTHTRQNIPPSLTTKEKANLNFNIIKKDLSGIGSARNKALLLQALIWRLIRVPENQRNKALNLYISNDLLGFSSGNLSPFFERIMDSKDSIATEYLMRFVNVTASFSAGRQYMSQSENFLRLLVKSLMKTKKSSAISENILGGLQKLSLRRNVQTILIDSAVVEWLFSVLDDPDDLSDYTLEYSVALLMNLCLRTSGKKRCCFQPKKVLKLLSDLLGFDNVEIRPYINGTLYSILSLPSLRETAISMGYEDILKEYLFDQSHDERQLNFIIKQLNTSTPTSDDDVQTDGEDDDDDDEEGDAVEAELDKPETISAMKNEQSGEDLLQQRYTNSISSNSPSKKPKKIKSSLDPDLPYTRPLTPASRAQNRSSINNQSISYVGGADMNPTISFERPRTSSGKGARKTTPADEASPRSGSREKSSDKPKKGQKTYMKGFSSRPKIPRTPEVHSNPSSARSTASSNEGVPPLTRSISPSRPDSSKGLKPLSRDSNKMSR
eukprot:TCONS_00004204-protein